MNIRMIVGAIDATGCPSLLAVTVECTKEEYDNGTHYEYAKDAVTDDGYTNATWAMDETDQKEAFAIFDSLQVVPVYVAVSIVKAVDTFCVNNALDPRTFIEGVLRDAVTPSLDQGAVL